MHIQHSIIQLAGHSLQRVDFDPLTFQPEDLLWLPHHARLSGCVRKRQSEHLAGRIAAVYALREVGEKASLPLATNASPCGRPRGTAALATANAARWRWSPPGRSALISNESWRLRWRRSWKAASSIARKKRLDASGLPPELALTLAFSAKESAFKASHSAIRAGWVSAILK